jgi:hypothetical protein
MTQHSGEKGTPTCYADTHLRGPGYMAVCRQVSNAVATDDMRQVTCSGCLAVAQRVIDVALSVGHLDRFPAGGS